MIACNAFPAAVGLLRDCYRIARPAVWLFPRAVRRGCR